MDLLFFFVYGLSGLTGQSFESLVFFVYGLLGLGGLSVVIGSVLLVLIVRRLIISP